ncbi:MAG: asparagine synthase (glutamine-hydrolyzing), partial [Steroidobacter sp.]
MCGIAGTLYFDAQRSPERSRLQRMVQAIAHRGPDGDGYHVEPGVGLGHARLSIIDIGGGAQPIHNGKQTVWITYNGEIFNYIELRQFLESRGHSFYTHTDTEVIVHLYEELGDRFVDELNGQFSFVIWDRPKRRAVLVRDRTGILPLYYAHTRDELVFASEVKAILASGAVSPELDPNGLDELMTFWAPLAPRTMFKGVSQLGPGEMLIVENGTVKRRQYWEWDFPTQGEHRHAPQADLEQELREILSDATRLRLRADVPVG